MQILSFLKKNILIILVLIVLLITQALGVVALPEYISKIVDVGIRSYGIENSVPIAIRESEMEKLKLFIRNDEILSNFQLVSEEELVKYNLTKENKGEIKEKIYILKENVDVSEINYEFARAITILQIINDDESIREIKKNISSSVSGQLNPYKEQKKEYILKALGRMNKTALKSVNDLIDKKITVITEDVLMQVASKYLADEYETLGYKDTQMNYIVKSVVEMLVIAIIIFMAYIIESYLMNKFSSKMAEHIRNNIFEQILKMENEFFDRFTITSLINRSIYDTQIIQRTIPDLIKTLLYVPVIFIGAYCKIRKLSNGFENTLIFVALIIFVIGALIYAIIIPKIRKVQKGLDKINSIERDSLNNIFISRGSGRIKQNQKFAKVNNEIFKENSTFLEMKSLATIFTRLIVYLVGVYILWQGGIRIEAGALGIGSLMAIIEYLFQISFICIDILRNSMNIVRGIVSYKRCKELFVNKVEENKKLKIIDKIDTIEFKNIYFRYPMSKDYTIRDFSLKIENNDHVAITGKNASGKSTLIKLLLKFYKLEKGEILINGININEIDTESLRQRMGVVLQENSVFSGSLDDNISFGNENLSYEEIDRLKNIVQLTEFDGQEKAIFSKGTNISGGQKQRIAIARALAKNPDVLILDNAFSSLDENTKKIIKENITKEYNTKMIINIEQEKSQILDYTKIVEL